MAGDENPRRIFVRGLARTAVERKIIDGRTFIVEECNLGDFFYNRGCNVTDVRLMVDWGSGRCRGFGFVDFEDDESFQKALTFAGTPDHEHIQLDPNSGGRLQVEVAKPADASTKEQRKELAKVRDETEGMARSLRLREARVRELERELKMSKDRQQQLEHKHAVDAQIAQERARQEEIREAEEALLPVEEVLLAALREQEDRTRALEAMVGSTCSQQTRRHTDEHPVEAAELPDGELAQQAAGDAFPAADIMLPVSMEEPAPGEPQLRIKNTFIEYVTPPDIEPLVRTKTAPAVYPSSPWLIKRETSQILRSILDEKMDAEEDAKSAHQLRESLARGKSADEQFIKTEELLPGAVLGPSEDQAAQDASRPAVQPDDRCIVRLRNLPLLSQEELEQQLLAECARLWSVRGLPMPEVKELQVVSSGNDKSSYAAAAAGSEAIISFERPEDAAWLVDGRRPGNWSSLETISLRGRVVQAEWPPTALPDWRRLRYKADTDASSEISYATAGTRQSFSSAVARHVAEGSVTGRAVDDVAGAPGARSDNPAANRTVVLVGLPQELPEHTARQEVLDLLRRAWQRGGYSFDPQRDLHRGAEGGLVVRRSRRPEAENDGTCLLRLRNYADAKWLVEQARGLHIEGKPLRAMWARPRPRS